MSWIDFFSLKESAMDISQISVRHLKTRYYVKYYPELAHCFGSEKAALIVDRLEYWFGYKPEGFYKFYEPCKHVGYRKGDSWREEIGLSRRTFNHAFAHIGVRYHRFSAFKTAQDKFQGKMYACYHCRLSHLTYFVRNHAVAESFFTQFLNTQPSAYRQQNDVLSSNTSICQNGKNDCSKTAVPVDKKNLIPLEANNCNGSPERPKLSFPNNSKCRSGTAVTVVRYIQSIHTKHTSFFSASGKMAVSENQEILADENTGKKMQQIWIEEIGKLETKRDKSIALSRLAQCLEEHFESDLVNWHRYCLMIASSNYLMGEMGNEGFKKIWLSWATTPKAIGRIMGGEFSLGDRETTLDKKIEYYRNQIHQLKDEQDRLNSRLSGLEIDKRQEWRKAINKRTDELTEAKEDQLKQEFEKDAQQRTDVVGKVFREAGWSSPQVLMMYRLFVSQKISHELFGVSMDAGLQQLIENHPVQRQCTVRLQELEGEIQEQQLQLGKLIEERRGIVDCAGAEEDGYSARTVSSSV